MYFSLWDADGGLLWSNKHPDNRLGMPAWTHQSGPMAAETKACFSRAMLGDRVEQHPVQIGPDGQEQHWHHVWQPAPSGVRVVSTSRLTDERIDRLSRREQQVLRLMPTRTTKQIALDLGIARGTVHTHTNRMHHKLGMDSHEMLVFAVQQFGSID